MVKSVSFISIIIPTHNRCQALQRTLDRLHHQTWPKEQFEVVVVADGCHDGTLSMLAHYVAPFSLTVVEQPGRGAAVARNQGAGRAKGELFLFLDDDIEAFPSLVEAHVRAHERSHPSSPAVVIGHLPMPTSPLTDFFQIRLRNWWANKFHQMSLPQHRWTYQDLLSGNFSPSSHLFKALGGFDETFQCREDYELGMRLLKAGARFYFEPEAKGWHHDVTDLKRSLRRKLKEGQADIQMGQTHPELLPQLLVTDLHSRYTWLDRWVLWGMFHVPALMDGVVNQLHFFLQMLEWLRFRGLWQVLYTKMQVYWYLRGVTQQVGAPKALDAFLQGNPFMRDSQEHALEVDLHQGITQAEALIDRVRPHSLRIRYGSHPIGSLPPKPGAEAIRGIHLREALATTLSYPTLVAIALNQCIAGVHPAEPHPSPTYPPIQEQVYANQSY